MKSRRTESTGKNATSSRSHAVVKIRITETDPQKLAASVPDGFLFLVDLAGSERAADRAGHSQERLAESKLINTSLMTLKDCIKARGSVGQSNKHVHIPYRASKLTTILRDCFELGVKRYAPQQRALIL